MASKVFPAIFYDGRTSERWPVELFLDEQGLSIRGNGIDRHLDYAEVRFEPQVGTLRGQIRIDDGGLCEVEDGKALMEALPTPQDKPVSRFIHKLENRLQYIFIVLLLAIAVIWSVIEYGIPVMARSVAHAIPMDVEKSMGDQVMTVMDRFTFEPSTLPENRKARLQEKFAAFIRQIDGRYQYQIEFRASEDIGANAFALPGGRIIFTDDMVILADDERELLAVLAHEIGHVEERHAMRHVLQDSITVVLLVMLTGDIESATSLVAALPTVLVQTKYSRRFESEADAFASRVLRQQGLSTKWLATVLQRLDGRKDGGKRLPDFFASHPSTPERIDKLRNYDRQAN